MIKNYIKIAWRNLRRNKSYAAINIIGLSLSIACGILIFTLVSYHLSFDEFHHNRERIYRIVTEIHNDDISYTPGVPPPFAKAFRNDYTLSEKVAEVVTFGDIVISFPGEKANKKFQEEAGVGVADPEFFDIFNFPLIRGDFSTALKDPNTAIITEKIAKKYFGNDDPIGKIIRTDNKANFKITGILKNIPINTDRRQEIYVSRLNMKDFSQWISDEKNWGGINSETQVFTRVKPGVTLAAIEKTFPSLMIKYYEANNRTAFKYRAQPLTDLHFNPNYNGYAEKKYLWALALIGLFLIITACVNFINLATAQAVNRAREVGIRKVLGSLRAQLFWQFIAETALITLFAIFVGYGLAALGLPYLNRLFETQLTIGLLKSFVLPLFLLLLFVIVVFLSGSYPGLVLSAFQPVVALKGKLSQKSVGGFSLRRILVITQFSISQMLIIGTIVIAAQMHYSKQSDLGFKKAGIVMLPVPLNDSSGIIRMQAMKNRLLSVSGTENVSFCMQAPASSSNNTTSVRYDNRAKDELWSVNSKNADDHYLTTFNLKLIAGRNIYPSDTLKEFVVNETFVRKVGLKDPREIINKLINIDGHKAPVVGVVKDFYNYSFRTDIAPIAIFQNAGNYGNCAIRMNMTNAKQTLAAYEKIWNDTYPEFVYTQQFLDERIAKFYDLDDTMLSLIKAFAGIAIFIGCLGLYGLVSFMAVSKTKEIGVRKVLGASIQSILWLFGREFSRLLLIAFVIAAPVAWWAMHTYLQDFKYRIPMGPGIFLLAIVSTFIVAAFTISVRSVKAALTNPVKSLRSE